MQYLIIIQYIPPANPNVIHLCLPIEKLIHEVQGWLAYGKFKITNKQW